jgi:hypothetical protein
MSSQDFSFPVDRAVLPAVGVLPLASVVSRNGVFG